MSIIPRIADTMQTVLTTTADYAGRLTGFVKRERKFLFALASFCWFDKDFRNGLSNQQDIGSSSRHIDCR
jgi:hypothetical protein